MSEGRGDRVPRVSLLMYLISMRGAVDINIYIYMYIHMLPPPSRIYHFRVLESQMQQTGGMVHLFNITAVESAKGWTRVILTFIFKPKEGSKTNRCKSGK